MRSPKDSIKGKEGQRKINKILYLRSQIRESNKRSNLKTEKKIFNHGRSSD